MGYTTEFSGSVTVDPPLNEHEISYLKDFARSRRMDRTKGPYYANPGDNFGQDERDDVKNYNGSPDGQPGLWCQWVPSDDGTEIEWDGGEKFYEAEHWMAYLINHFIKPDAVLKHQLLGWPNAWPHDERFDHFTFDHVCNGEIDANGEDAGDVWRLVVDDNKVYVEAGEITFSNRRPIN